MIVSEEVYLKHVGIKGMRWGVRNRHINETPKQRTARRTKNLVKVSKVVRYALIAATGATVVSGLLLDNQKIPQVNLSGGASSFNKNIKTAGSLADRLRREEAQRNGAFQIKQILKRMGENTI